MPLVPKDLAQQVPGAEYDWHQLGVFLSNLPLPQNLQQQILVQIELQKKAVLDKDATAADGARKAEEEEGRAGDLLLPPPPPPHGGGADGQGGPGSAAAGAQPS